MLDAITATQVAMLQDQLKLQSINQNVSNMQTPGYCNIHNHFVCSWRHCSGGQLLAAYTRQLVIATLRTDLTQRRSQPGDMDAPARAWLDAPSPQQQQCPMPCVHFKVHLK